jgi:hypothetical protein
MKCIICGEPATAAGNLCTRHWDLFPDGDDLGRDDDEDCTCWSCRWFGSHG